MGRSASCRRHLHLRRLPNPTGPACCTKLFSAGPCCSSCASLTTVSSRCPEGAWRDQKQNPLEEKEKPDLFTGGRPNIKTAKLNPRLAVLVEALASASVRLLLAQLADS